MLSASVWYQLLHHNYIQRLAIERTVVETGFSLNRWSWEHFFTCVVITTQAP
jgi:hypothetical protein